MKIRNDRILWIAAAAFYAVVLPVSGWMGMAVENSKAIQAESGMLQETEAGDGIDMAKATPAAAKGSGEVSGIGENGEENPMEETGAEGAGDSSDVISGELTLTPEQLDAVKRIDSALSSQDMEQAARILDKEQDILATLFYENMAGSRYLYTPSGFTSQIEGEGMVFTMPGTVFYGFFKDGKPRGECLALQFINVDSPRYNYSYGIWRNGKMTGYGSTGYCYYENVPLGENVKTVKQGNFKDDLLEGEISYETKDIDGTISHWYMAVSEGVTVIDTRWTRLEESKEYQLMSADAQSHAYLIGDDQIGQVMLMNLLGWDI